MFFPPSDDRDEERDDYERGDERYSRPKEVNAQQINREYMI